MDRAVQASVEDEPSAVRSTTGGMVAALALLTQAQVDGFLHVAKRCATSAMTWSRVQRDFLVFQSPLQGSGLHGTFFAGVNCAFTRNWTFKITFQSEEI